VSSEDVALARIGAAALVVAGLATLAWWGLGEGSGLLPSGSRGLAPGEAERPPAPAPGTEGGALGGDLGAGSRSGSDALPPLPISLAGTEVEGDLRVDAAGRFAAGPEALRLFDYYLSARDEEPLSVIRERIEREIAERLPEGARARARARALFEDYLAYLRDVAALEAVGPSADEMEERLERLAALRREHFGAERAADLFAEDEKRERVSVERRRILDDPELSDRDRIEALAELQRRIPDDVREAERRELLPMRLAMQEDRLRAEGASEGEIRALRERLLGGEATPERMEELDRQRRIWERRMEAYRRERDAVLDQIPEADEPTRARFIRDVRSRHFSPEELPRVEAIDRIEARQQGETAVPRSRSAEERERGAAQGVEEPQAGTGAPAP